MSFPTRRTFGVLAFLIALFIVWMSAIPFNFQAAPTEGIPGSIYGLGRPLPPGHSRADVIANALVFAAFGLFGTASLALDRRRARDRVAAALAVLACSLLLSASVEFAQVFLPRRESSLADLGWQSTGTLAGVFAFLLAGERPVNWLRAMAARREYPSAPLHFLIAYAAVVGLWRLFPLDFTVRPGTLWSKIEAGRLSLVPFGTLADSPGALAGLAEITLTAAPLGALAMLLGVRPGHRRSVWVATLLAGGFLALLEVLGTFSASGTTDTGNILAGSLGALAGALVVRRQSGREVQRVAPASGARWMWAGTLGWALVVTVFEWNPFRFSFEKEAVREGLERLTLVPFAFLADGDPLLAFTVMTGTTLLAIPLGLLGTLAMERQRPSMPRSMRVALTCLGTAALLSVLEAGQVFLSGRVPDTTDVLLPAAAAGVTAWVVERVRRMEESG